VTLLDRYLFREIFRNLGIVILMVVGVYLAVDFFEKIDNFMEAGLPFRRALSFFLLNLPFVVVQVLPIAVLLGVLISLGLMNKHVEIIALKSCGVGVYALLKPVLLIGGWFSVFLFVFAETVVPMTAQRANGIWYREVRKESLIRVRENNIWLREDRAIIHIQHFIPETRVMEGITVNVFDEQFRLVQRVDAHRGVLQDGRMDLRDVLQQMYVPAEESFRIRHFDQLTLNISFSEDRLQEVVRKSNEMGFLELYTYIDRIEREGYPATTYRVDLQVKLAFPFVCIIMAVAGLGISLRKEVREGLPIGVVYGMGVAFLYWVLNSFCTSLAYGGMLPPGVAAWISNLVFGCAGGIAVIHAET